MAMVLRIGNVMLIVAALAFVLGAGALILAAVGPETLTELAGAVAFLVAGRAVALLLMFALAVALSTAVVVLVIRSVAAARRRRIEPAAQPVAEMAPDEERLINKARRLLDAEFCRTRPQLERVIDVLLGVPLDLGASQLCLEPGSMVVEISLTVAGNRHPVTSLADPMYQQVLKQLRAMVGGDAVEGTLEVRSSSKVVPVSVRLEPAEAGTRTTLEPLDELPADRTDPGRRRRRNSVVFRLEPPPIKDVRSGEIPLPPLDEHDETDRGSGLLTGLARTGEMEVAALVPPGSRRVVGTHEAWLRLFVALTLMALVVVGLGPAYGWGLVRLLSGASPAPWREVALRVTATPVQGQVTIEGRARGRTPLATTEPCRGQRIEILVRAGGFTTWQWSGLCPLSGPLELTAQLRPLRTEVRP
jgi:hypothetical protein